MSSLGRRPAGRRVTDGRRAEPKILDVGDETGSTGRSYARVPIDVVRLRELRLAKGWSQHELSVRVDVQGAGAVSAWEAGAAVPHPETLRRLARALDVAPESLLAHDGAPLGLAELRVVRGLSRRALAAESGVSLTTLTRWEAGDFLRTPPARLLGPVAVALEVSVARLEASLTVSRQTRSR